MFSFVACVVSVRCVGVCERCLFVVVGIFTGLRRRCHCSSHTAMWSNLLTCGCLREYTQKRPSVLCEPHSGTQVTPDPKQANTSSGCSLPSDEPKMPTDDPSSHDETLMIMEQLQHLKWASTNNSTNRVGWFRGRRRKFQNWNRIVLPKLTLIDLRDVCRN